MNKTDQHERVLLLLPGLDIGGAQEVVRTLARHLVSDECTPVVCSIFGGGPLLADLKAQGSPVEVLSLPRHRIIAFPWYVADMVRLWQRLGQVIARHNINVIQTNILGSQDFIVLALGRALGVPALILTFHNERFLPLNRKAHVKNTLHGLAYRLARRSASDYVAVSDQVKQAMIRTLGLPDEDITTICNGVDVERYQRPVDRAQVLARLGLEPQSRLIITVGTLKTQKGHRYLIDAAPEVALRHPAAHFLFVGDGELRAELEAQTRDRGVADKIHFLGSRRDVVDLLAVSDVFVLPSLWEGLAMALLEAMAAARPVVATAVSGTSQVMVHSETGLLIPPKDTAALAQAIDQMLSDPDRANGMGQAARRHVEAHWSVEKQAAEYKALYRRLLER